MITAHLRRTVRALYAFACGYCGVAETEVGSSLTIYPYQPEDAGGSDEIDNLVYACHACNLHKSAAWNPQIRPFSTPSKPICHFISVPSRLLALSALPTLTTAQLPTLQSLRRAKTRFLSILMIATTTAGR